MATTLEPETASAVDDLTLVRIAGSEETVAEHLRNALTLLDEATRLTCRESYAEARELLPAIHRRVKDALGQAEAANFTSMEITEFVAPTLGDVVTDAHADLGLITETAKGYADAVAYQRELDTQKYVQRDAAARRLADAGTTNGRPISYTAAEKVAVLDPAFARYEQAASDAEHATILAHAEYLAAQTRAQLSVHLVHAHVTQGAR